MKQFTTGWTYVLACSVAFLTQSWQMFRYGVTGVSPVYLTVFLALNWLNVAVAWQSRPAGRLWTWVLTTNTVNATGHTVTTAVFWGMFLST